MCVDYSENQQALLVPWEEDTKSSVLRKSSARRTLHLGEEKERWVLAYSPLVMRTQQTLPEFTAAGSSGDAASISPFCSQWV